MVKEKDKAMVDEPLSHDELGELEIRQLVKDDYKDLIDLWQKAGLSN